MPRNTSTTTDGEEFNRFAMGWIRAAYRVHGDNAAVALRVVAEGRDMCGDAWPGSDEAERALRTVTVVDSAAKG